MPKDTHSISKWYMVGIAIRQCSSLSGFNLSMSLFGLSFGHTYSLILLSKINKFQPLLAYPANVKVSKNILLTTHKKILVEYPQKNCWNFWKIAKHFVTGMLERQEKKIKPLETRDDSHSPDI